MWHDIHLHLVHYIFLLSILVGGVISFLVLSGNAEKQFQVVLMTAILYFLWGIAHHHLEGDLHIKIVIEYLLISILSVILLKGVIFR
ncbi:hypothetical protein HYW54_00465 [Candidatus Gottesmanbacteria bacterium]|nr:hypothetical protein [Candidatus Gottesmanbacteria bacterium]